MRTPRSLSLSVTGVFHKMWRAHNRECVFAQDAEKYNYLNALFDTYTENFRKNIQVHGYCLMGTHTHEVGRVLPKINKKRGLKQAVKLLGNWMRNAHSRFGMGYNRRHGRQGKVAYDRPRTTEIKNEYEVLKTMFYCDANPVRAGIVYHPSNYKHSSYRFYAFGERNKYTAHLTPPQAYLGCGKTAAARRKKYRRLCDLYLRQQSLIDDCPDETVDTPRCTSDFEGLLYAIRIRGRPLRS
ncbi:MAG: hypothetical protein QNJ97_00540 [Myxococcota bacterium]|nr:hypothetical protein [Myxococcota bacterium]